MGSLLVSLEPIILVIHFVVALFLIVVILLQSGKGSDIGSAFGAGSSQSVFGVRGAATLLSKITTAAALIFLLTSVSLATVAKFEAGGVAGDSLIKGSLEDEKAQPVDGAPAK